MLISRKRHKIATYFQWKSNRKSYVAYQIAPLLVTLNDLEGHSPVAGLFECNPSNICAVFYQISTVSASRDPSTTAGLLVFYNSYCIDSILVHYCIVFNLLYWCVVIKLVSHICNNILSSFRLLHMLQSAKKYRLLAHLLTYLRASLGESIWFADRPH